MPVTLAMPAIDMSISAHRITKVRPTAMMPVTETWVRMLPTLSSVAKEGLAAAKKPLSRMRVRNGPMLRIWERNIAAILPGRFRPGAETLTLSSVTIRISSRRFQQAVLADRLIREFAHHRAALEHDDAVGERQNGFGLGRDHDDGEPARAQVADDVDDVAFGAHVHAPGRLAQHQKPRRIAQPFCQRHLLLIAARQHAEGEFDRRPPDLQLLDLPRCDRPLARRLEKQLRNAAQDADRDVLVDRFLVEQHGAAALGNEGDAGAPRLGRAAEGFLVAGYDQHTVVRPELAEQDPCQLELPAPHETVDAEHFAGAHLERDLLEAAGEREAAGLQHHRPVAARRQRDIVGVALFELLAARAGPRFERGR